MSDLSDQPLDAERVEALAAAHKVGLSVWGPLALPLLLGPETPSLLALRASVESLAVDCPPHTPVDLRLLPRLKHAQVFGGRVASLEGLSLQTLTLREVSEVGASQAQPLKRLFLLRCAADRLPAAIEVTLDEHAASSIQLGPGLRSLHVRASALAGTLDVPEGTRTLLMHGSPGIKELTLPDSIEHLTLDLAGLSSLRLPPGLKDLHVSAPALRHFSSPPQRLSSVCLQVGAEELDLSRWSCPELTLADCGARRVLLPPDCVLARLDRTPRLQELVPPIGPGGISLNASALTRAKVPAAWRWRCSWAAKPSLNKLRTRTPPRPPTPVAKEHRSPLSRVRKLLSSRSMEDIDLGLELLLALDRAEWWDALLDGCEWQAIERGKEPGLDVPSRLRSKRFAGTRGNYVLTGLLGTAPPSAKCIALRDRITRLDEPGRPGEDRPLNPTTLAALPNLTRLSLGWSTLLPAAEAPPLAVQRLQIRHCHQGSLSLNAPRLSALYLHGHHSATLDLSGLRLPALKTACFVGLKLTHPEALLACPSLERAWCWDSRTDLSWVDRHPSLKVLHVERDCDLSSLPQPSPRVRVGVSYPSLLT